MEETTKVSCTHEVYAVLAEIEQELQKVADHIAYLRKRAKYSRRGGVRLRKAMLKFCKRRVELARNLIEAERKL